MFGKNYVFISHSSHNKDIAEQLCVLLSGIGVDKEKIFCSSIVGQGIDNGEKLNEAIANIISKSKLLIFLISYDFISSSYCMEELGVGWYLRQNEKAKCFYLVLPDVELSELQGFVNSKIDKFSFVSESHRDDLGLFAENICKLLGTKLPKHSVLLNLENTFFSAIKTSLEDIVATRNREKEEEEKREKENEQLKKKILELNHQIEELNQNIVHIKDNLENELLEKQFETICKSFYLLGSRGGISKKQYIAFSEGFWFNFIDEYVSLSEKLGDEKLSPVFSGMELIVANIYSHHKDIDKSFVHIKKYVTISESNIYPHYFDNVFIDDLNILLELINVFENKIENTKLGIVQDSYKKTIDFLIDKKNKITKEKSNE